jgi:hypothetical protein
MPLATPPVFDEYLKAQLSVRWQLLSVRRDEPTQTGQGNVRFDKSDFYILCF